MEILNNPRVGDIVRLKDGRSGVVAGVVRARDVLYEFNDEADAFQFGERMRARLGPDWMQKYFKVAVRIRPDVVEWVEWSEVANDQN